MLQYVKLFLPKIAFKHRNYVDSRFYTFCGGAIIGKTKILSAAHCFVERRRNLCFGSKIHVMSLQEKYAVAGTIRNLAYFKEGKDTQWRAIQTINYPNDYDFPSNDIAVLFVVSPFKYNSLVQPIKVDDKYRDYEGLCLISGYGDISHSISSDSLLKAYLYLFPYKVCSQLYPDINMYRTICTSVSVADIGKGDSGGPLVYSYNFSEDNRTLIGVASASYINHVSLFIRVSSYRNFIANCCGNVTAFYYVVVVPPRLSKNHPSEIVNNISYVKHPEYKKWIGRIMNGWEAKLGEVPYQVSIKGYVGKNLYRAFCGGTLISPRKVISAAHCFHEPPSVCKKWFYPGQVSKSTLQGLYAVAGNLHTIGRYEADGPNGQWRTLESVTYPKKYKFPAKDIAVGVTRHDFIFTKYIKPIRIATRRREYAGKCLASGFGRTGWNTTNQSEVLLLAHLVVFPTNVCNKLHGIRMKHMICSSSSFTDVGKGDSGGPLVCANTGDPNEKNIETGILVGVVSGHQYNVGSFFSRVSRYHKFIDRVSSASMIIFKFSMQLSIAIATSVLYKKLVNF